MVDSQPGSAVEVLASAPIRPVDISERITAIDTLRGFALLGILLMNVVSMGMYGHAYDNPTVTGGATGANLWIWTVMHVLAEGKMRCLFSLVFGASVVLLLSRMESRKEAADIYYRRTYWMMAFGIVHAYLLWEGEILYPYAVCGLLLYTFRNMRPRRLIAIGLMLLAAEAGFSIRGAFERKDKMEKGQAAVRAAAQNRKLTEEEEEAKRDYEKFQKEEHPDAAFLKKLNDQWRGNPWQVIQARAKDVYPWHAIPYFHWWNFDMWSMMFIGMGLLKLGVFSGERPARFYWGCILIGYGIGVPLNSYTAWLLIRSGFDPVMRNWTGTAYDVGRLSVALGHLGAIMLLCQKGWMRWLTGRLGAIGQTALSNYVFQSVVTAFIFTGYGFALYGRLERYQLYYVVAGIWVVQLIVSPIWVRHFRFGPMEWCWRSLTYWKKQPMRLAGNGAPLAVRVCGAN